MTIKSKSGCCCVCFVHVLAECRLLIWGSISHTPHLLLAHSSFDTADDNKNDSEHNFHGDNNHHTSSNNDVETGGTTPITSIMDMDLATSNDHKHNSNTAVHGTSNEFSNHLDVTKRLTQSHSTTNHHQQNKYDFNQETTKPNKDTATQKQQQQDLGGFSNILEVENTAQTNHHTKDDNNYDASYRYANSNSNYKTEDKPGFANALNDGQHDGHGTTTQASEEDSSDNNNNNNNDDQTTSIRRRNRRRRCIGGGGIGAILLVWLIFGGFGRRSYYGYYNNNDDDDDNGGNDSPVVPTAGNATMTTMAPSSSGEN
eukprot:scaffold8579_cov153-Amphora_coffeaeformis.AAC.4